MAVRRFGQPVQRSSTEQRTYDGRTYASKLERMYAQHLDALVLCGQLRYWLPQVTFKLGADNKLRVDYLCWEDCEDVSVQFLDCWAVDVKGYSRHGWTKTRELWLKYAPIRLIVVTRKSNCWQTIELVDPDDGRSQE